jgi:hypothetical protein
VKCIGQPYSYTRLTAHNATDLLWEQVSVATAPPDMPDARISWPPRLFTQRLFTQRPAPPRSTPSGRR